MRGLNVFVTAGLFALAGAAPYNNYVVHTKRDEVSRPKWRRSAEEVHPDAIIPLAIALTQQNLDNGYDYLMDVSDPASQNYGKHWSLEKVAGSSNLIDM